MTPEQIMMLIQIATQLAQTIDTAVQASDSAEVQAAWQEAQGAFTKGFNEAYGSDQN